MTRESGGVSSLLVLIAGCGLVLNVDPDREVARDSGPGSDVGGLDAMPDVVVDDVLIDVSADASVDLRPPLDCGEVDDGVLAYYRMEHPDGQVDLYDELMSHPGTFVQEPFLGLSGPCGTAFDTGFRRAAVIPHDDVFRLPAGSVDLLVQPGPVSPRDCRSLLGRDATNSMLSGHFSILANGAGHVGVRLQGTASQGATSVYTDAPLDDSWHFLAINFGPRGLEVYLDGVRQTNPDSGTCDFSGGSPPCLVGCETGIDGNANPWVVGAAAFATTEGGADATDIDNHYSGAIDEVRISNGPRAYAGFDPLP